MKKYITLFLAGALTLGTSSCGDSWLDLEPSTSVPTDETITALSDVNFTLNGVYNLMQNAYAYSGRLVYYGDVTGDDMQAYSTTKRSGSYYLFQYTKDNAPSTFWSYPYKMIASCNLILEKIDELETSETELRDYYKGQTLALRGMFLFDLTRFYGYPYKKDNGASLGVPIIEEVLDKEAKPSRNTVAECYTAVIRDLENGISLMNNNTGKSFQKGRMNRWSAMTLLSRVYLYHGDDQKAYDTAVEAIKGAEKEGYELWSNDIYTQAWAADASATSPGEVLFEIVNTTEDNPGKEALGYLHGTGYKDIIMTSSFYEMITEDANDVRNQNFVYYSKRAFISKYLPQDGEEVTAANIPLFRLSELYLNASEAAFKIGKTAEATTYLDAIVNRANPDKHVTESEVTLDRIMKERRLELVGEGHRMFDALRDGGSVVRKNASKTPSKISSTKHLTMDSEKMNFNWNYYKCVLPIPKAEMDVNPNLKQNPGYGD